MTGTPARFFSRVDIRDGCWDWLGPTDFKGYGGLRYQGRSSKAHRVARQLVYGDVVSELTIDHLCLNTTCVRPDHLELVTVTENNRRRWLVTPATRCRQGHRLELGNIIFSTHPRGTRQIHCLKCRDARYDRRKAIWAKQGVTRAYRDGKITLVPVGEVQLRASGPRRKPKRDAALAEAREIVAAREVCLDSNCGCRR